MNYNEGMDFDPYEELRFDMEQAKRAFLEGKATLEDEKLLEWFYGRYWRTEIRRKIRET